MVGASSFETVETVETVGDSPFVSQFNYFYYT